LPVGVLQMEWKLRLVGTEIDGRSRSFDVMEINRPDGLGDIANLGLTLAEAQQLLAITVTLDSTFIRCREDGERHLEVYVGNVETGDGGRQVFGAVARTETDITALIR
jgi:hypothetical protein